MTDTQAVRMVPVEPTEAMLNAARATLDFGEWIGADYFRKAYKAMVLAAGEAITDEEDTYKIGKRDGYEAAVQDIDHLTGGDGEYRVSSDDPDRHVPDAYAMKTKIVERFAAAPSVQPGAVGWPVHVVLATGDYDEQKAAVRQSETYKRGDMVLAWVNEGDLYANPYVNLETLATLQPVAQKEEG